MKKLLVSACLIGQNCKYNGGNNFSSKLDTYIKEHDYEVIPVCPEVLGGLLTPRVPAEIVNGTVTNKNGISVHTEFCRGAKRLWKLQKVIKYPVQFCNPAVQAVESMKYTMAHFQGKRFREKGFLHSFWKQMGLQY